MKIRDMMTEQPSTCSKNTSLQDVARMMRDNDCGMIPVVDQNGRNQVIGTITDRDIVIRSLGEGNDPNNMTVEDVMSGDPYCIQIDASDQEADQMMAEHKVRRLPVIDNNNDLVGVISQADLAQHQSEEETGKVVKEVSEPSQRPRS